MLKNFSRLEVIVNDKIGHFLVESDAPLPVMKEMLFQFQKFIGQYEDQVRQLEAEKAKEEPKEESKEES